MKKIDNSNKITFQEKEYKKKINKNWWWIIGGVLVFFVYALIVGLLGWFKYDWKVKSTNMRLLWLMLIMFVMELLSTATYQLRIWLTTKDKISTAAFVGSLSWGIASIQAFFVIADGITNLSDIGAFFIKLPVVIIATFTGIMCNNIVKDIKKHKEDKEKEKEKCI